MGSSFIEYRGFGFWSFDPFIERLAGEVAAAIENQKQKEEEEWQAELAAHWKVQASGGLHGWVHLNLDGFLTGEDRRKQICDVVQALMEERPTPDDPIHETGVLLLRLLDGKLTTDAASPLEYMVGRNRPESGQR